VVPEVRNHREIHRARFFSKPFEAEERTGCVEKEVLDILFQIAEAAKPTGFKFHLQQRLPPRCNKLGGTLSANGGDRYGDDCKARQNAAYEDAAGKESTRVLSKDSCVEIGPGRRQPRRAANAS